MSKITKPGILTLPEAKAGEQRPIMMPYNVEVLATYKGRLAAGWMLPPGFAAIGAVAKFGSQEELVLYVEKQRQQAEEEVFSMLKRKRSSKETEGD